MTLIHRILYPKQWAFAHIHDYNRVISTRRILYKFSLWLLALAAPILAIIGWSLNAFDKLTAWYQDLKAAAEAPIPTSTFIMNFYQEVNEKKPVSSMQNSIASTETKIQQVVEEYSYGGGDKYLNLASACAIMFILLLIFYFFWDYYLPSYNQMVRNCLAYKWRIGFNKTPYEPDSDGVYWYDETAPYEQWVLEHFEQPKLRYFENVRGRCVYTGPRGCPLNRQIDTEFKFKGIPLLDKKVKEKKKAMGWSWW